MFHCFIKYWLILISKLFAIPTYRAVLYTGMQKIWHTNIYQTRRISKHKTAGFTQARFLHHRGPQRSFGNSWRLEWRHFGGDPYPYQGRVSNVLPYPTYRQSFSFRYIQGSYRHYLNTVFQDLQRPNSRFSRTQKNAFSRTFQDTLRSQAWLYEVKKCTYQISFISFRCNCITVHKQWHKCNTCGVKMHTMYYNEFLLWGAILEPESKIFGITTLEFQDFSSVFQDIRLFPWPSRPGDLNILISGLSRVCTNPVYCISWDIAWWKKALLTISHPTS